MEKINYLGKEVRANLIADIDGFTVISTKGRKREGADKLWRDEAGIYYLKRFTYRGGNGGRTNIERFEAPVHKLSIKAAALWVAFSYTDTNDLRFDCAEFLTELGNREAKNAPLVAIAGPSAMTLTDETMSKVDRFARMTNSDARDVVEMAIYRHMEVATEDDDGTGDVRRSEAWASFLADVQDKRDRRVEVLDHGQTRASAMKWNTIEDLADGGMVICLHLKPEPARLLRAACLLDEKCAVKFTYDALAWEVSSVIDERTEGKRDRVQVFRDHAPEEDKPISGTVFKLDETATELVDGYRYATPRVVTLDQIVNGAIADSLNCALNDYDNHSYEELSAFEFVDGAWGYTEEHIMRAAGVSESEIEARANYFERRKSSEAARSATPEYDRNPQPDFSLNAAAPEPVEAPGTPETSGDADNAKEEA